MAGNGDSRELFACPRTTFSIAFCLISNQPVALEAFCRSLQHAMVPGQDYAICLSLQKPEFDEASIPNIKSWLPRGVELRYAFRNGLDSLVAARVHKLRLAVDDFDYLIWCDDDFRFNNGTKLYQYTAGERYLDCIRYLELHKSCAMVCAQRFRGATDFGRWIIPKTNGWFETGVGIVLRGKQRPYKNLIHEDLVVPGGLDDGPLCFTAFYHGYYVAKACNTPINKKPSGKIWQHGDKRTVALAQLRRLFTLDDDFTLGQSLPSGITQHYRQRANAFGHIVMF